MIVNEGTKKLLMTLGLGARARALVCGTSQICDALRSDRKKLFLVLEASDTSENTHKRLNDKCAYYGVRLVRIDADTAELGYAVGKRAAVAAAAITDAGISRAVEIKLEELEANGKQT